MGFGQGSCIGYTPWHSAEKIHVVASLEDAGAAPVRTLVGNLALEEVFERIDLDKNGKLSLDEMQQALNDMDVQVDPCELKDIILAMDKDLRGEIGLEEFRAAFKAAYLSGGVDVYIPLFWAHNEDKGVAYYQSPQFKMELLRGDQ